MGVSIEFVNHPCIIVNVIAPDGIIGIYCFTTMCRSFSKHIKFSYLLCLGTS